MNTPQCVNGHNNVTMSNGECVNIKDLKIGDNVVGINSHGNIKPIKIIHISKCTKKKVNK